MNFLTFLFPFIERFTTGRFIRRFFAILYRVFGWSFFVIGTLAMLTGMYAAIKSEQVMLILGALICMPILAIGGYLFLQISLYKAKCIDELDEADYTAIPVVSNFIRYLGELFLATLAVQGLLFLLASLFVSDFGFGLGNIINSYRIPLPDALVFGSDVYRMLLNLLDLRSNSFEAKGLMFLANTITHVLSLINGVLVMLFFYFIAEINVVLAEIASNTRRMVKAGTGTLSSAEPSVGKCNSCGCQNDPTDRFCTDCGNPLT